MLVIVWVESQKRFIQVDFQLPPFFKHHQKAATKNTMNITYFLKNSMWSSLVSASCMDVKPKESASLIVASKKPATWDSLQAGMGIKLIALSTKIPRIQRSVMHSDPLKKKIEANQ